MLRNYLKIAFRNLWKNKTYASINILGLAVAFASALLLFLTAHFELSFDSFQENKDHIFKVYRKVIGPEKVELGPALPEPFLPSLRADFGAEIKHATRIKDGKAQIVMGDKTIDESVNYVDTDFLKMFSFKMLKGNRNTALNDLRSVVLNQTIAEKVFGNQDPIGKTLNLNLGGQTQGFVVAGVTEKSPDNSTIENAIMLRFESDPEYQGMKGRWEALYHEVYLQLADKVSSTDFEKRLKTFVAKYYAKDISQLKSEGAKPDERGEVISARLLPLLEEHFTEKIGKQAINKTYPIILLIICGFVLLIACINFINLSIARSLARAKEVGMRKALGALKAQVIGQFWGEALLICLVAFVLGCAVAALAMPQYNALFKSQLSFSYFKNPIVITALLLAFLVITLVAGGYPAWLVARFNTVEVLKGKVKSSSRSGGVRNALIVVQFSIASLLIIGTLVVWNQIQFMRAKPLGFNEAQVVSIPVNGEVAGERMLEMMRNKLANQPAILSLTGADNNLGRGKDGSGYKSVFGFLMNGKNYSTNGLNVDYDYVKTLDMKLLQGRDFSKAYPSDKQNGCIINETMAKQLGFKNPIGQQIPLDSNKTIVGVVADYHFESLKNKIESMTFFLQNDFGIHYIFVKVAPTNTVETMALLEKTVKEISPKSQFLGSFLDENTNNLYRREERIAKIFMSAATLAILLSCLGLFAISLMMMQQRTKEIGIRKVLGATVGSVVLLLSKDFLKLVFVALVIASPVAWYLMDKWLADFAYRTEISWLVFAAAGALAVCIALLTVGFQAIKAALMNPVQSLKTE
ncbi:MAG: ABC transporter permease [Cytophagales bacterium]|nr:MAG: ABC transporter permease [Cytophagales bacterium]